MTLQIDKPRFNLIAGPNGAGKSSLYRMQVDDKVFATSTEFINADIYEKTQLQHIVNLEERSLAARQWADTRRETLIAQRQDFISETVFSHPSKLDLILEAQSAGYFVTLYVVCVDDPNLLLKRVAKRVSEGGHDVPTERILARYARMRQLLKQAIRVADVAFLYDSAEAEQGGAPDIKLFAIVDGDAHGLIQDKLPDWGTEMLGLPVRGEFVLTADELARAAVADEWMKNNPPSETNLEELEKQAMLFKSK